MLVFSYICIIKLRDYERTNQTSVENTNRKFRSLVGFTLAIGCFIRNKRLARRSLCRTCPNGIHLAECHHSAHHRTHSFLPTPVQLEPDEAHQGTSLDRCIEELPHLERHPLLPAFRSRHAQPLVLLPHAEHHRIVLRHHRLDSFTFLCAIIQPHCERTRFTPRTGEIRWKCFKKTDTVCVLPSPKIWR